MNSTPSWLYGALCKGTGLWLGVTKNECSAGIKERGTWTILEHPEWTLTIDVWTKFFFLFFFFRSWCDIYYAAGISVDRDSMSLCMWVPPSSYLYNSLLSFYFPIYLLWTSRICDKMNMWTSRICELSIIGCWASQMARGKESACQCSRCRSCGLKRSLGGGKDNPL